MFVFVFLLGPGELSKQHKQNGQHTFALLLCKVAIGATSGFVYKRSGHSFFGT